jgi:imidazolonepropionase-like amidohydrolase
MAILPLVASPVFAETSVFINVNLIPMAAEEILSARTVIVTDGRIEAIGEVEDTPVPDDAVIIDGTDRFLMPGLSEMHGHVPSMTSDGLDRVLQLYVANGITTVRGMLGEESHLEMRRALKENKLLGPRLFTSGPSFNGRSVTSPERAISMVEQQHAAGYDFLKIHPGLTRDEFDAMAATADRVGIRFAGHVPEDVGIDRALEAGIATIDHLDGYMESLLRPHDDPSGGLSGLFGVFIADQADESKIGDIVAATVEAGTWNVPTDSLFRHWASAELDPEDMVDWPEMKYMPADTVARWHRAKRELLDDANYHPATAARAIAIRQKLILELHRNGAGLLLGSDSPQIFNVPGFAIHRELEYLVDAGLTPFEALQTGTANPAKFFGKSGEFGVVQTGAEADLILLDANPLDDISNTRRIHGVMIRGRWLPRNELDELLDGLAR